MARQNAVGRAHTVRTLMCFVGCIATLASSVAWAAARALPLRNPCAFVTDADVLHLLGWTVESRTRKPYDLHGGTGAMCFIASTQGQVIVILPDPGTDFPGISVYNDPNAEEIKKTVYGLGAEVTLYNGTVYVTRKHRDIAVRVVPQDHAASYNEVEGFAKVVISHMR